MRYTAFLSFLFVCFAIAANCQDEKYKPAFSAVFDSSNAAKLLKQCSRSSPENVTSFWTPAKPDIDSLDGNFEKAYSLVSGSCCLSEGKLFDSLSKYAIQYAGLIIKSEKFIYVNAFPLRDYWEQKMDRPYLPHAFDPKIDPWIACGGGEEYWGVLYNTETKEFTELAFNGSR